MLKTSWLRLNVQKYIPYGWFLKGILPMRTITNFCPSDQLQIQHGILISWKIYEDTLNVWDQLSRRYIAPTEDWTSYTWNTNQMRNANSLIFLFCYTLSCVLLLRIVRIILLHFPNENYQILEQGKLNVKSLKQGRRWPSG